MRDYHEAGDLIGAPGGGEPGADGLLHRLGNDVMAILGHAEVALAAGDQRAVREELCQIREIARRSAARLVRGTPPAADRRVSGAAARPTILLVEDDARIQRLLLRVLERGGYRVLTASRGEEALEIVGGEEGIALLMTDVFLPGMRGDELVRRAEALRPGLPILFSTGCSRGTAASLSIGGRRALLCKPFTMEQLLATIRGLIAAGTAPGREGLSSGG